MILVNFYVMKIKTDENFAIEDVPMAFGWRKAVIEILEKE